jgi:hypothetical protein
VPAARDLGGGGAVAWLIGLIGSEFDRKFVWLIGLIGSEFDKKFVWLIER